MSRRRTTETPLLVYGPNAVAGLLRSGEPVFRVALTRGAREAELAAAARARGVVVESLDRASLDRMAGTSHHQGAVAVAAPYRYVPFEHFQSPGCPSALVLDGIQDPRNLGAILRTARASGAGGVILPRDRAVAVTSVVAVASAGLLFGLPIARVPNLARAMDGLKQAGYWLIGLVPQAAQAIFDLEPPTRPALVVGGEGEGLRALVRRNCDFEVSIPMAPGVESLNVAVAAGIALYEIRRRRRPGASG